MVKIRKEILTLNEQKERGLIPGFILTMKWVARSDRGKRRKFLALAKDKKSGKETKLNIPRDPATTFKEMNRLMYRQGQEILFNPETGEYYTPPIKQILQISKTPVSRN